MIESSPPIVRVAIVNARHQPAGAAWCRQCAVLMRRCVPKGWPQTDASERFAATSQRQSGASQCLTPASGQANGAIPATMRSRKRSAHQVAACGQDLHRPVRLIVLPSLSNCSVHCWQCPEPRGQTMRADEGRQRRLKPSADEVVLKFKLKPGWAQLQPIAGSSMSRRQKL